jgi:hypothetical protein
MPPAGAKWTPPLHAQDVVGTGHKFGDKLKSGEPWHKGTDLQAVHGTSTQSPVDGMVVQIDNNPRGLGLSVVILDEQGKEHKLSHLSKALVKNGDHVRAGQEVGKVGSTGNTTGAHLDYRIQKPDGQYENPEPKMPQLSGMPPAPGTEMMTDTGAGQGGMPDMGGGASNSAAPQMPSAGGGPPSSPPAGGGPDMNDPRMAMLLQMIMQALGKSGGMPGGASTPPPAPPSPSGGAPSLAPPGGMGMGAGADAKEMGVGAGGMRLANGNWSDALADTPQNQSKYGQGSGFSGNVGYSGSSSSAPKNQGGTGVAISPADQARLQLDTQVAQNNLNIQKQQNAQAQQNENDRHNEALQQLQQQAQQEADYKAIQDAVNAENVRHDQATEQLTQKQQALDLQLEQMKEQFTAGQNAMATMQSALNAPWLQGLLGLGVNPGSNAGPAIPGASNPWTNLLNIIFGGGGAPGGTQQGLNPLAATGAATQAAGTPAAGNTAAGPALPSAQQWAQMNPAQKAALQASVMAEGPGAWQSFQSSFQNQNGPQAPDMTQLQSALQTPEDQLGTQMNAEMFGEGAPAFQQRQQNTWVGANAPSVQQTLLQGTGFGQDEAHPKRGRVPAGKGSGKWSSQNRKRGWSGKRPRSAGMAV